MKMLLIGASCLALLLSGCAPTANDATAVAPKTPVVAAGAVKANGRINGDPALWVVKDADTTVYLFGTVHVLKNDTDWFDDQVRRAHDASSELVLEMIQPEGAVAQEIIMAKATDPDGPPLSAKLTPAASAKYRAAMQRIGVPVAAFETLEPWMVSSQLGLIPLMKIGYSPEYAAEAVLTRAATAAGKRVTGLETFEQQIGFFDGLPEAVQLRYLASVVDELPSIEPEIAKLVSAWARGDADGLGAIINEGLRDIPEIGAVLLTQRNARWAQWVDDRLDRPGTSFVAVGAGHLAGNDSVQAYLAQRGIKATRVR